MKTQEKRREEPKEQRRAAPVMDQATHNKIVSFIWGIADDVLRDLFKRGKYPDVILPMCVLRRLDAVLESTKKTVLDTKQMLDDARITEQRAALCAAAGQAFYNTSKFTLRDLKSRGNQQQLLADFEDYLNGFSSNVQDILENFKFRNQLVTLSKADALGTLIAKFLDPEIDLSPMGVDSVSANRWRLRFSRSAGSTSGGGRKGAARRRSWLVPARINSTMWLSSRSCFRKPKQVSARMTMRERELLADQFRTQHRKLKSPFVVASVRASGLRSWTLVPENGAGTTIPRPSVRLLPSSNGVDSIENSFTQRCIR